MNPIEFIKQHIKALPGLEPTWDFISSGSPFGMLTLAPKNEPVREVVANRKNRHYAAKINREIKTERRAAERRKVKS